LRRDSQADAEPLAAETVALPPSGELLTLQLVDRPMTAGDAAYVIEVAPRDDETDTENNRQRRVVAVREAKIRVLIVQGYPSYEFRFLKSLLERDSTIELATYLQDADPDFAEQDKTALRTFPVGRDEIFRYDAIIVGDVDPRLVPRSVWQHLRAFVTEKGGGVAFVAGPRFLPWPVAVSRESRRASAPAGRAGAAGPVDRGQGVGRNRRRLCRPADGAGTVESHDAIEGFNERVGAAMARAGSAILAGAVCEFEAGGASARDGEPGAA
jgi:hypothetical protein